MVADIPNWFFSTWAFIGFVLCMIPLPWHIEAWNTGTCLYMIWTGLACLNQFINSVAWNSDVINRAPVWCDISSYFMVGSSVAIPAATLCINRRLYQVASIQSVTKTRAEKRRDVIIDLAIGIGLPILVMILHIVVQAHRFLIIEEIGCFPYTWNTPLAYPLYFAWPVVIGLVSAYYSIRTIRELAIRRAQFKEFLSTNGNLSSSRYFRLMALAGIGVLCVVVLACVAIYIDLTAVPLEAYVSWDYAHSEFGFIDQIPSVVWQADQMMVVGYEVNRWFVVFCAVVFFAFFGFADEARRNYRFAYVSVAKRVGLSTGSISTTGTWTANGSTNPDMSYNSRSATMPVIITHQMEKKRDSLSSFSSRMSLPDYGDALADLKKEPVSPSATSSGSSVEMDAVPLPSLPEATLDTNAPPRYAPADASHVV